MIIDDEFDRLFKRMSGSFFNLDELLEEARQTGGQGGPVYYGYAMTVGPDGKPVVREYGNMKPGLLPNAERREPLVDAIVDEKDGILKLVAEMPGVEKDDVKVVVEGATVSIDAERGSKKYHVQVPLEHKVDQDSAKANYRNGILELAFKLAKPDKPKGKTVEVQ
ncbi:molecular chaperone (small heat shock protein) [Cenarchaeum symbiosum A]|uniref:Molecular chaperone (Small heat shock protein) n=1 Tax=Cenarchaeum symbiosum (strain A) TaxID=414004 RepID=A0RYP0_CENSY|nr:molecular chaperone (small heat shock protein) [Cenarchaeum symbiosum A]